MNLFFLRKHWSVFQVVAFLETLGLKPSPRICKRRYPFFHFRHGEKTSRASQLSKDLNKVPLLLKNLG